MDGLLEAHIWASCRKLDRRPQEREEALRLDSAQTAWVLLNDLNKRIEYNVSTNSTYTAIQIIKGRNRLFTVPFFL